MIPWVKLRCLRIDKRFGLQRVHGDRDGQTASKGLLMLDGRQVAIKAFAWQSKVTVEQAALVLAVSRRDGL